MRSCAGSPPGPRRLLAAAARRSGARTCPPSPEPPGAEPARNGVLSAPGIASGKQETRWVRFGFAEVPLEAAELLRSVKRREKGISRASATDWVASNIITILSKPLSVPGFGLQIQCYQCEEFQLNNDCSSPEFIVNCTVNVQDMCQKEVMEKSFGKNVMIMLLFIGVGQDFLLLAPPFHSLQLQINVVFPPRDF